MKPRINIGITEIGLQYKQSYDTLPFELSVPAQDVIQQLLDDLTEDRKDSPVWISGILDIHSGSVIGASVGRRRKLINNLPYSDINKNNCNMS